MKFETIIFDMDGVIIDSEILFDHADTEFFRRYEKIYNREEVALSLAGMHLKEGTALLKERYQLPGSVDDLMGERQELLETQYLTNLHYIIGFERFHERVVAAGFKTCIATSSNDHLLELAKNILGLEKKFGENIFKASDVGCVSKPNPAIYLFAAEKMGTAPDKCVVIEDAPKGVQAAKNAGMFCIGITTSFTKDHLRHADLIVDDYEKVRLGQLMREEYE